jgi:hypothetical protein
MWFITSADPSLRVPVPGKPDIVFRNAEYRTEDPEEIAALQADKRVKVATPSRSAQLPQLSGFAVNLNTEEIHDLERSGPRCHLPAEVLEAEEREAFPEGWKHYLRLSDAERWTGADKCAYCFPGESEQ